MRTHGRKALGLVLMAALGLMAFSATAQAALSSRHTAILLGGTYLKAGESKTLTGRQTSATGVLSIPAKNTEIVCKKGEVVEATAKNETDTKKNPEGKELTEGSLSGLQGMSEGVVEFSECVVNTLKLNEKGEKTELKESAPCTKAFNEKNKNPGGVAGRPRASGLILTYLHLSATGVHTLIVRVTQLVGKPFSTLEFGGTCSLPEKVEVTGSIAGEISSGSEVDVKEVPVNIESETAKGKAVSAIAETKLNFGASEAFLEGKAVAELTGVASWGVM